MTSPQRDGPAIWPDLRPNTQIGESLLASTPLYGVGRVAEKLLSLDQLNNIYIEARRNAPDETFFTNLLDGLNLRYRCPDEDLARIPATGPAMIVSNHPFGLAEGPVLASVLLKIRKDVRFLANSLLQSFDRLREYVIAVDPFGGQDARKSNISGIRAAIEWLRQGGLLVVFPAGEVSSFQFPQWRVADVPWSDSIGRVARMTSATIIPVYFHGANSAGFHLAGLVHPRLRTALIPRELFNKRGQTIDVSVGTPIASRGHSTLSNRQMTAFLRTRTELLQTQKLEPAVPRRRRRQAMPIPIPGDPVRVRDEVEALPFTLSSGPLRVCVAEACQIPCALAEIGRLREITFRAAGEGTGCARDLDRFDEWYRHLFLWNSERRQIVGAYRIAMVDTILEQRGPRGLYTSTLFRLDRKFLAKLGPALELGRSFVRLENQREYGPLLLLWKGICHFAVQNPRYRTLFGPVSISNDYRSISRALMVEFFNSRRDPALAREVQPRHRVHSTPLPGCDRSALGSAVDDVAGLSQLIADLEPDKKGVPVLLRQYLNMGGKILEFNLDPQFSNAIDGLVFVDLLKADRRLLSRYMSREGLASFYAHHGIQ